MTFSVVISFYLLLGFYLLFVLGKGRDRKKDWIWRIEGKGYCILRVGPFFIGGDRNWKEVLA